MKLDLPFPHRLLWPNGSEGNRYAKSRERKRAKSLAWGEALAQRNRFTAGDGPVPVRLIVHAKPRGPLPDRDNCIAAMKSYQDGIASAIGIDDKHFAEPIVEFAEARTGRFVIEIGIPRE